MGKAVRFKAAVQVNDFLRSASATSPCSRRRTGVAKALRAADVKLQDLSSSNRTTASHRRTDEYEAMV